MEEKDSIEATFSEESYDHLLDKGEEDFDDFTQTDLERLPELGYDEKQVQDAVDKLSPVDRAKFLELKKHYQHQYRLQGYITPVREVVQDALDTRYPGLPGAQSPAVLQERERLAQQELVQKAGISVEGASAGDHEEPELKPDLDISKLSLYPAKTITDVIDLTLDEDQNLYIKVEPNQSFHHVLTCREEGMDDLFTSETNKVEEISIHSDEEDPFTAEVATKLLRRMAQNKKEAASLQEEAADLLEEEMLPLEEAKEIFKSGIEENTKMTKVSEWLFDDCKNISEFHLILALGYRVKEQAKAQRVVMVDKVPRPVTYKKVAEIFKVNANTLMNNLNLAVDFHNRRLTRSDKRRSELDKELEGESPPRASKTPRTDTERGEPVEMIKIKQEPEADQ